MKYTVERIHENGVAGIVRVTTDEATARRVASRDGGRGGVQVYITWYRDSDGQHGYLNRDGHSPVGQAW